MIDMDTRMRLARGIAKNETRASVEVFSALKRRGHPESPPPIASDGRGGIGEAMVEVYGKVPAYQGRGRPPARKRPDPAWQYLQVVKQRPLWASTGTKNPAYSDVMYVEQLIAPDTVNTMPEATLFAFLEHGRAEVALNGQVDGADQVIKALAAAGISMEAVTVKLLADGVKAFADSYDRLLANIADKKAGLLAGEHKHAGVSPSTGLRTDLGNYLPEVEAALSDLQRGEVMGRIWRRDHTVWNPDPTEITDRLGWLTVTDTMCDQVVALEAFTEEVRDAGYRQVVLLGMGGSSLGPEVLRQSFQTAEGYPELIVLDSTVPAWVQAVTDNIDPARTLFLVSSKSGSTIEPNTFYAHFRTLVDRAIGKERAGPRASWPLPTPVRLWSTWPRSRDSGGFSATPPISVGATRCSPTSVWCRPLCRGLTSGNSWTGATACGEAARLVWPLTTTPAPGWGQSWALWPNGVETSLRWLPLRPSAALRSGRNSF